MQSGPNQFFNDYLIIQECMHWGSAHISKYLLCFILDKCSVNPPASKPAEDDKWAKEHGQISNDVLCKYF